MFGERKLQQRLLELLETLNNLSPPKALDETEDFLLYWMKVRKIAQVLQKQPNSPTDIRKLAGGLIQKFELTVLPRLKQFNSQVKNQHLATKLNHIFTKLNQYMVEAQHALKVLPAQSYEIYQDALFFLNLYRFAFPDPEIYKSAKRNVHDHIYSLRMAFVREAGNKELHKEQESLDQKLTSSLKGKSPNIKTESPPSIQKEADSQIIDQNGVVSSLKSESEKDLISGVLSFPEEAIDSSISPPLAPIKNQTSDVIKIESTGMVQDEMEVKNFSSVYAFSNWFPQKNQKLFKSVLYCDKCGSLVSFQTQQCMSCAFNYQNIIRKQPLA